MLAARFAGGLGDGRQIPNGTATITASTPVASRFGITVMAGSPPFVPTN
jgi:hypothetical protein